MPKHAKQQPSIPIFGSEEPLATVLAALEIEGNDVCFDCDRSVVGAAYSEQQRAQEQQQRRRGAPGKDTPRAPARRRAHRIHVTILLHRTRVCTR